MALQYNEPLCDEVLETTVFFAEVIVNVGKKKSSFLPVPWSFVISRFHYTTFQEACCKQSLFLIAHPKTCKKRLPLLGRISGDIQ